MAATKKKAAKKKAAAEKKERKPGVGAFCREQIKDSEKTNAEIAEMARKKFPGSKTSPATVAWYRNDMKA